MHQKLIWMRSLTRVPWRASVFIVSLLKVLNDVEAGYAGTYPQMWKQDGCVFKANLSYIAKYCLRNTKAGHVAVVKHLQGHAPKRKNKK